MMIETAPINSAFVQLRPQSTNPKLYINPLHI